MLFKAQADRKEKTPKCYRNEGKYPELKAKLQACSHESKTAVLKAVLEFIPSRRFCGFLSVDAFSLIRSFCSFTFLC